MAHKVTCFASLLEKINIINLQGENISGRVMDAYIDWRNIRTVIIIDDVVISGTTLHDTIVSLCQRTLRLILNYYFGV